MENRPISGIICEFNPLHNGHKKLLEFASNGGKTPVVCILSGNFVQRGDAALFDKWTRCRLRWRAGPTWWWSCHFPGLCLELNVSPMGA